MTKKVVLYLKELGLSVDEVESVLNGDAGLNACLDNDIIANIELVISFGYPRSDMDVLILANPSFLLSSRETLEASLKAIKGDIEEALKENPYLI